MEAIGPSLPLTRDTRSGVFSLITTYQEEIEQNFKNLVLTSPGERVMNPDFGVGISRYLFQQEGNFTSGAIQNRIFSQVSKYLPYIEITDIEIFERTDLSNTFQVTIEYFIPSVRDAGKLVLNLTQQDGTATGF